MVDGSTFAAIGTADDASIVKAWYSASDSTDFSLNIPDYTRYARTQKGQTMGQL